MKMLHVSDLHIGRMLSDYSLIEDQRYALNRIIDIINFKNIDVLLICGDIYDKANPSDEALSLVDEFITKLSKINGLKTIIVSGNHDNDEKLKYLSSFLKNHNIFIYTELKDLEKELIIQDVSFLPIPYLTLGDFKTYYKDSSLDLVTYHKNLIDDYFSNSKGKRHVCLCHNFISGSKSVSSERSLSVGGIDDLPKILFEKFDYTALGHLHTCQKVDEKIYYSGSLLKYSEDEVNNKIGAFLIDLDKNLIERIPYPTLKEVKKIEGEYDDIVSKFKVGEEDKDYTFITLVGDSRPLDAYIKLKYYYPNLCRITIKQDINKDDNEVQIFNSNGLLSKSSLEVFKIFYKKQYGKEIEQEELDVLISLLDEVKESE